MHAFSRMFFDVARCEVVRTTSLGRGDPLHPEPDRQSRTTRADIRLTKREMRRWKREAKAHGVTLSEYVRAKVNDTPLRVFAMADPAIVTEIRRQGINLNQLVHAVNGGLPVDAGRLDATIDALRQLYLGMLRDGA